VGSWMRAHGRIVDARRAWILDARWGPGPTRDARGRVREVIGRSPGMGAFSRAACRRESATTTRETRGLTVR